MTFRPGPVSSSVIDNIDAASLWDRLIERGLISGDATLYENGSLQDWEYGHAIATAFENSAPGSADRIFLINALGFNTGGEFQGDTNFWINLAGDDPQVRTDLFNAATRGADTLAAASGLQAPDITGPPDPGDIDLEPAPEPPTIPDIPDIPDGPAGGETPDVPAFDYEGAARLIAPWLPPELIGVFADAWAEFGDSNIALAAVRQDPSYDQFFPGIKRDDGSLRMSEQEYMAQLDAYSILLLEYGINPGIFSGKYTDLIAGDVSAAEFGQRLDAAYTQIITNFDEVRGVYSDFYGVDMTDEAIFASFIDEEIGQAILDRRISVAQVGGAAAVQGFGLNANYAERLVNAGLSQQNALAFFGRAANEIPTLQRLATRFNDPDSSVDITEFAEFGVFQDPTQTSRFRRLQAAESSSFTEQSLTRFNEQGTISGLRQR